MSPMQQVARRDGSSKQSGFTLLELIIVVSLIGILAAIVLPNLIDKPTRAKEAVLKTNLRTLRDALDQYYADKGKYPGELSELVDAKYLRSMPLDPITGSEETWVAVYEEFDDEEVDDYYEEESEPGIVDVKSGSELATLDGSGFYNEW